MFNSIILLEKKSGGTVQHKEIFLETFSFERKKAKKWRSQTKIKRRKNVWELRRNASSTKKYSRLAITILIPSCKILLQLQHQLFHNTTNIGKMEQTKVNILQMSLREIGYWASSVEKHIISHKIPYFWGMTKHTKNKHRNNKKQTKDTKNKKNKDKTQQTNKQTNKQINK